jgi:hypothetical protein
MFGVPLTSHPPSFAACTETSDSKCEREDRLSIAAVAAVIMAIILVLAIGIAASSVLYRGREQKRRELGKTQNFLELTERLLGDERVEKERWAGAYMIPVSDLTLGNELGNGAFGRVVRGMWGYGAPRPCLVGAVDTLVLRRC